MFPELIARAGFCIIECTPKLVPLFARSFPDCDVVPRTEPPHPYTQHGVDFQVPSGSLGALAAARASSRFHGITAICGPIPQRVDHWRRRLRHAGFGTEDRLLAGAASMSRRSAGSPAPALEQWAPVLRTPGAHFVCLQYDDCSAELEAAQAQFGVPLHRFGDLDLFNDLDEAAALTRALDLVISAPTAVTDLSAGPRRADLAAGLRRRLEDARRALSSLVSGDAPVLAGACISPGRKSWSRIARGPAPGDGRRTRD